MAIGRPVVIRAEYLVSTDELVKDLERRYGQVKLASWTRMLENTGVVERPWSAPLEETAARSGVGVRSRAAYESVRDRAVKAAREALEQAGLGARDVDVLVTTHTTSWSIPGLDVDLVGRLGLRPDVERIGLATAACAGGGHALVHATRALRGRPGKRALVVAGEDLSTLYRPGPELPTMVGGVALLDVLARTMTDGAVGRAGRGGGLRAGVHRGRAVSAGGALRRSRVRTAGRARPGMIRAHMALTCWCRASRSSRASASSCTPL